MFKGLEYFIKQVGRSVNRATFNNDGRLCGVPAPEIEEITDEELKDRLLDYGITYEEYKALMEQVLGEISEEQNERLCKS